MDGVFSIVDLDGYADAVRIESVSSYTTEQENLDDYISLEEIKTIVSEHSLGIDDNEYHIVDEETHWDIVDTVTQWIVNIGLAKLAGQNKIECGWDNETNEMVFWIKDKETNSVSNNNDPKPNNNSQTGNRSH